MAIVWPCPLPVDVYVAAGGRVEFPRPDCPSRFNDPRRGRQTFGRYVTAEWLPNHVMEITTREAYTYQISKHIMPWFGPIRMNEIMPANVREWVTDLQAKGVTPATIQKVRFILSAIFTAALDDVTFLHPCKGRTADPRSRGPAPQQFHSRYSRSEDGCKTLNCVRPEASRRPSLPISDDQAP